MLESRNRLPKVYAAAACGPEDDYYSNCGSARGSSLDECDGSISESCEQLMLMESCSG